MLCYPTIPSLPFSVWLCTRGLSPAQGGLLCPLAAAQLCPRESTHVMSLEDGARERFNKFLFHSVSALAPWWL